MSTAVRYSIDTSALLDGMKRYYPPTTFKQLWIEIDHLIAEGRLIASEEVHQELKIHDDEVNSWMDARSDNLVVPTDARITTEVTAILTANPRLVMNMKGRNRADPFVIAVARIHGATVVTGEGGDGTQDRPKIPYICKQLSVPCIKFLDVITSEDWRF